MGFGRLAIGATLALGLFYSPLSAKGTKKPSYRLQFYEVQKGETLESIAANLGVKVEDLVRWNRLKGRTVKPKMKLRFYGPKVEPESIGRPSNGRLVGGVNIDPDGDNKGIGWVISAHREGTWATPETIRAVKACIAQYRNTFKRSKADPVAIGDLSKRHGGPFPPHKSHQSGRDVDIGYILTKRAKDPERGELRRATPETLDLQKQWFLTKCFLDRQDTQVIFMETSIAKALRAYIEKTYKRQRMTMRKYLKLFDEIVATDEEHVTHMHVRFKCPKGDKRCIP